MTGPRATPSSLVVLGVLGIMLGLVGAVVSAARVVVGGVTVPWGLVLMALTVGVATRAVLWSTGSRGAAWTLVGTWFLATGLVLLVSPGQDVLLPDVPRTYAYLLATGLLGILAALGRLPAGHAELFATERPLLGAGDVLPSGEADGVR